VRYLAVQVCALAMTDGLLGLFAFAAGPSGLCAYALAIPPVTTFLASGQ
jgi:hypothetical protein